MGIACFPDVGNGGFEADPRARERMVKPEDLTVEGDAGWERKSRAIQTVSDNGTATAAELHSQLVSAAR